MRFSNYTVYKLLFRIIIITKIQHSGCGGVFLFSAHTWHLSIVLMWLCIKAMFGQSSLVGVIGLGSLACTVQTNRQTLLINSFDNVPDIKHVLMILTSIVSM